MRKFISLIFLVSFSNLLFSQWTNISIKPTTARIYDIDARRNVQFRSLLLDTIVAVGWNYSFGFIYLTTNSGSNWDTLIRFSDFFPFGVHFLPNEKIITVGYNYYFDEANVYFIDQSSKNNVLLSFDGNSLPYCKNFFDIAFVRETLFICGYNGQIFRYSLLSNQWEDMPTNSNSVFLRINVKEVPTKSSSELQGFAIAGKQFDQPTEIYRLDNSSNEWKKVFDFLDISKSFIITAFDFFYEDSICSNSIVVAGTSNDTMIVFKSIDNGEKWYEVFRQQTLNQPVGLLHNYFTYLIDDAGNIWKSLDFGENWTQIHSELSLDFYRAKYLTGNIQVDDLIYNPISFFGFGDKGQIMRFDIMEVLSNNFGLNANVTIEWGKFYNILGQILGEFNSIEEMKFWLNNLPKGLYIISGFDSLGRNSMLKFTK